MFKAIFNLFKFKYEYELEERPSPIKQVCRQIMVLEERANQSPPQMEVLKRNNVTAPSPHTEVHETT